MNLLVENPKLAFSLLFRLFGCVMFMAGLYYYRRARASNHWPFTTGIILSSEVSQEKKALDDYQTVDTYKPEVCYAYQIGGEKYTSKRIRILPSFKTSSALALRLAFKYHKDSQVSVFYNPDKPDHAVLEPGVTADIVILMVIGGLIFLFSMVAADYFGLENILG
jgi:hypothetical protein